MCVMGTCINLTSIQPNSMEKTLVNQPFNEFLDYPEIPPFTHGHSQTHSPPRSTCSLANSTHAFASFFDFRTLVWRFLICCSLFWLRFRIGLVGPQVGEIHIHFGFTILANSFARCNPWSLTKFMSLWYPTRNAFPPFSKTTWVKPLSFPQHTSNKSHLWVGIEAKHSSNSSWTPFKTAHIFDRSSLVNLCV